MKSMNLLDLFWAIGLVAWFCVSIYCLVSGNSDLFPRMGAVLVAIAVGYFALMPALDPQPYGLPELTHIITKRINLNEAAAYTALDDVSILAASTKKALDDVNISYPNRIVELADLVNKKPAEQNHLARLEENTQKSHAVSLASETAGKAVARQREQSQRVQAIMVVIGTLQWGFGDLLFKSLCEGNPC